MADQKNNQVPSIQVGGRTMYPDSQGMLHPTPGEAIGENQRVESDQSRGASGGCNQDASKVPSTTEKK